MFSFTGSTADPDNMMSQIEGIEGDEEEEKEAQKSNKSHSEQSEKILAQVREQFKKKEAQYKQQIARLNTKISSANEMVREKQSELSFAYNSTMNEYGHLETSQREQVMKKDLQIKLLKDRIGLL